MIRIDNVSLQLNKRQILNNISLDLHPGDYGRWGLAKRVCRKFADCFYP